MKILASDSIAALLESYESDREVLGPGQFERRSQVLDRLDALLPHVSSESSCDVREDCRTRNCDEKEASLARRLLDLRDRLEAANVDVFEEMRDQIRRGVCPHLFVELMQRPSFKNDAPRGIGYDYLDELVAGVLQLCEPGKQIELTGPENVFYQPTPARHIFALIKSGAVSGDDSVMDLGSGLGHVPLLASICTGVRCVGVELEPAFVACARQCATGLNLARVSFVDADARKADLSIATVFYLYTPFTGSILHRMLDLLKIEAATRPIKVCTFGPCTQTLSMESWLTASNVPETDQITIFSSAI